jgi:hypothetical protein
MQLETVMHHVEDESERLSESAPPSAHTLKMKRRSTLSRKIGLPDGYEKEEGGSAPSSMNLDSRDLSIESHHVGREVSGASSQNRAWLSPFRHTTSQRMNFSITFFLIHFLILQ